MWASRIKLILMERDDMTETDADELIKDAQDSLNRRLERGDMQGAEAVCEDWFGLEPDYLDELI